MLGLFKKQKTWRSSNFGERKNGLTPSMIILHYTGMKSAEEALERLCDPASEVSAHYLVEENGSVHNLVDEDQRAWHAGASFWDGESDINSASIGIEIVSPGHEFGYRPFPKKQLKAVKTLCREIMARHKIKADNVLAHSDIAPGRKSDPGELFPWAEFAAEGIGLWPNPNEYDYQNAQDILLDLERFYQLLYNLGYNPEGPIEDVVIAFHRHFYPEKFESGNDPSNIDVSSVARLLDLLRQREENLH